MEHQDWTNITLNGAGANKKKADLLANKKTISKYVPPPETIKMEAPTNLGQLILQARNTKSKTQKVLATELKISASILSRWETNKEAPTNKQIADIEKTLGVKLPRSKKVNVDPN